MLRNALHVVAANYALAMFWVYLAAFGVAFISIFIFPLLALGLVIVGACALVPAAIVGRALHAADRAATRPYLRRGICPACRAPNAVALDPGELTCVSCGSRYAKSGEELEGRERREP